MHPTAAHTCSGSMFAWTSSHWGLVESGAHQVPQADHVFKIQVLSLFVCLVSGPRTIHEQSHEQSQTWAADGFNTWTGIPNCHFITGPTVVTSRLLRRLSGLTLMELYKSPGKPKTDCVFVIGRNTLSRKVNSPRDHWTNPFCEITTLWISVLPKLRPVITSFSTVQLAKTPKSSSPRSFQTSMSCRAIVELHWPACSIH